MQRHLFQRGAVQRGAVIAAWMVTCGGVLAQVTPAPSPAVPATPPTMTPALPPLAPSVPPATTQPTQPLSNPASQPAYGGQGYAPVPTAPMITGAGQPVPDARMLSRSDSAATAFRALDPMNRGYVTRADTDKISGFMGFDSADTDRDGRLTPDEFYNAWKYFAQ
jgi:hypothetical protein